MQVKSRATAAVLASSIQAYRADGGYQRMFVVCHSPEGTLASDAEDVAVWSGKALARRAVEAGLLGWLIERAG